MFISSCTSIRYSRVLASEALSCSISKKELKSFKPKICFIKSDTLYIDHENMRFSVSKLVPGIGEQDT